MWKKKLIDGTDLGISKPFIFTNLNAVELPKFKMNGEVHLTNNTLRCKLVPTGFNGEGGHSTLEEHIRIEGDSKRLVLLKKSKYEVIDIRTEAFIHWYAHKKMASVGLGIRVTPVFDIVTCIDDETAFTIGEYTGSKTCSRFLLDSTQFQRDFFHILAQLAILVQILEDLLSLDHRDLKSDNILITPEPSILTYTLSGIKYTLKSPFTVCIVDFGYACLGGLSGITEVDAAKPTFPPLDPCPKDGRDLFHFIVSIYCFPSLRPHITGPLAEHFQKWMTIGGKSVENSIRRFSYTQWLFLRTLEKEFEHPFCTPRAILETLQQLDPSLFTTGS